MIVRNLAGLDTEPQQAVYQQLEDKSDAAAYSCNPGPQEADKGSRCSYTYAYAYAYVYITNMMMQPI